MAIAMIVGGNCESIGIAVGDAAFVVAAGPALVTWRCASTTIDQLSP